MSTDLWINRVWQEFHAGNLTRTYRDVLLKLLRYRSTSGHMLNNTLEDAFRRRYSGFRLANDDGATAAAAQ